MEYKMSNHWERYSYQEESDGYTERQRMHEQDLEREREQRAHDEYEQQEQKRLEDEHQQAQYDVYWAEEHYRLAEMAEIVNDVASFSSKEEVVAWLSALYIKYGFSLFRYNISLPEVLEQCDFWVDDKWLPIGEEVLSRIVNIDTCTPDQLRDK